MKRKRKNTKLKLMSIITERITDFVNADDYDILDLDVLESKTKKKITEEQLDEYIEEIPIDEEVGFITIREMRKTIKDLIKKGLDEEY
tara:strand:+ start:285 stop:548 length:264 start_codon:yes stop_codon:yes gene_type:complete